MKREHLTRLHLRHEHRDREGAGRFPAARSRRTSSGTGACSSIRGSTAAGSGVRGVGRGIGALGRGSLVSPTVGCSAFHAALLGVHGLGTCMCCAHAHRPAACNGLQQPSCTRGGYRP